MVCVSKSDHFKGLRYAYLGLIDKFLNMFDVWRVIDEIGKA
jgi:hypothetical protein